MAFIVVENPDINIWEANPSLELISEFKEFKEREGEERSSKILKAIYYIHDPKSDLRDTSMSEEKLIQDVTNNLIGEPDFDWEGYDYIKELYHEYNLTRIEKSLIAQEKEIDRIEKFINGWTLSKKDIKDRMAAMSTKNKLIDEYMAVKEKAKAEREELYELFGGYQKSMIEEFGSQ